MGFPYVTSQNLKSSILSLKSTPELSVGFHTPRCPLRPFLGDLNHHTRTRSDSQDCLLSKFRCRFWSSFEISCRTNPIGRITPPGAVMAVPKGQYVRVWWCLVAKHDFWQFWYLYGSKWSRLRFGAGHATWCHLRESVHSAQAPQRQTWHWHCSACSCRFHTRINAFW